MSHDEWDDQLVVDVMAWVAGGYDPSALASVLPGLRPARLARTVDRLLAGSLEYPAMLRWSEAYWAYGVTGYGWQVLDMLVETMPLSPEVAAVVDPEPTPMQIRHAS